MPDHGRLFLTLAKAPELKRIVERFLPLVYGLFGGRVSSTAQLRCCIVALDHDNYFKRPVIGFFLLLLEAFNVLG